MRRPSNNFSSSAALVAGAINLVAASSAHADVTISTAATAEMVCVGGVCSPTATDAVLNVNDLENLLASGNVEVTTTGSGMQANNIDVAAALSWSTSSALTLDAYESITINSAVSVAGLSGLSLTTNDGGTGGVLSFGSGGSVKFADLSSALTMNGAAYSLVDTIQSLASAIAANPSSNYAFANPYDAKHDGSYNTVPIPTTFTGIFEGLGNTISHLTINDSTDEYIGLFAQLGSGGTIRDLALPNSKVATASSKGVFLGILVGFNYGTIYGCFTGGIVKGDKGGALGGLVGTNDTTGIISFSNSSASVGNTEYGGLGGLAAGNAGLIEYSYATGNVSTGKYGVIGGLASEVADSGVVNASYATGNAVGGNHATVGGLVGETVEQNPSQISNSYATGSASVGSGKGRYYAFAGGLIGANEGASASTSYSIGAARSPMGQPSCGRNLGHTCVGGSIGQNGGVGNATEIYWDTTSSGNTNAVGSGSSTGITGLTTKQLKSGLPAGFDPTIWGEQKGINHGFPYLLALPPKK